MQTLFFLSLIYKTHADIYFGLTLSHLVCVVFFVFTYIRCCTNLLSLMCGMWKIRSRIGFSQFFVKGARGTPLEIVHVFTLNFIYDKHIKRLHIWLRCTRILSNDNASRMCRTNSHPLHDYISHKHLYYSIHIRYSIAIVHRHMGVCSFVRSFAISKTTAHSLRTCICIAAALI